MLGISLSYISDETPSGWDAILAKFKAGGVTDIFYNVLASGAHYNSAIYPQSAAMKGGFDSLSYAIGAAHELGMQVSAWLSFGAYIPYMDKSLAISTGAFADFGNPDAREAMRAITAEIVEMYPEVDGVDFDYCRYPSFGASQYYTAQNVYDAVAACGDVARGKLRTMHVKAYKGDPSNWGQPWPALYSANKIDMIVPMVYRPFLYGDFTPHIEAWTSAGGVPRSDIMPKISVIDTASTSEAYKTAEAWEKELDFWAAFDFESMAVFDQRATVGQLLDVEALVPEENEPLDLIEDIQGGVMGVKDTILAEAAKLEEQAAALLLIAASLRAQAGALEAADVKADELAALL